MIMNQGKRISGRLYIIKNWNCISRSKSVKSPTISLSFPLQFGVFSWLCWKRDWGTLTANKYLTLSVESRKLGAHGKMIKTSSSWWLGVYKQPKFTASANVLPDKLYGHAWAGLQSAPIHDNWMNVNWMNRASFDSAALMQKLLTIQKCDGRTDRHTKVRLHD